MQSRAYYSDRAASAAFYDLVTAADRSLDGDVDLYASLAPSGSVLELGSGTGRVAQALALKGLNVTGLELAQSMLGQAEAKRLALPPDVADRVRYVQGDMTTADLGDTFDAVICPFYALAHLPPAAWSSALSNTARHLKPGGLAAFHMPDATMMGRPAPPPETPVFRETLEGGAVLTLYVGGQVVRDGRMDLSLDYSVRSAAGLETNRSRERLTLFCGDLDAPANLAGFTVDRPPINLGRTGQVHVYRLRA